MATENQLGAPALTDHPSTSPFGKWIILNDGTATPNVRNAINEFNVLENPGGREASRFLQNEALGQDGLTRTHLLMDENEENLLGFFSCCYDRVRLKKTSILSLGLRTTRTTMPAFLLCWIARSRHHDVGLDLMANAYGLAQESAENVGLVAFTLDPMDDAVAAIWKSEPYFFQESETVSGDSRRLWLPV